MKKNHYVTPAVEMKSTKVENILAVSPGGGTGTIPGSGHTYGGEDDGTHEPTAPARSEWGDLWN